MLQITQISVCFIDPAQSVTTLVAQLCLTQWGGTTHTRTYTHAGNPPISGKAGAARTEVCKFWRLSREFEAQEGKVHLWLKLQRAERRSFKSVFLATRIMVWALPVNQGAQHMVYRWGALWLPLLWPSCCLGCMTNALTPCAALHTCWLGWARGFWFKCVST